MKKRIQSLSFLATLAIAVGMISWGSALHAQSTPPSSSQQQSPDTTQQPSSSQTPDSPPPDSGSKPSNRNANPPDTSAGDAQTFSGTVVKSGDKYVLKEDSGKTYDIDHQSDVAKFDGKRVRVQGTLDPSGTKILVK